MSDYYDAHLDADGYPTEKTLERLRTWSATDAAGALDFVAESWNSYGDVSHSLTGHESEAIVIDADAIERYLRLATGGWSGNENLIEALSENSALWALTWRLSARGGLYIFQYPPTKQEG